VFEVCFCLRMEGNPEPNLTSPPDRRCLAMSSKSGKKSADSSSSGDCTFSSHSSTSCLSCGDSQSSCPLIHPKSSISDSFLPATASLLVPNKKTTITICLSAIGLLIAIMHGAGAQIRASPPLIIGAGFLSSIVFFFLVVVRSKEIYTTDISHSPQLQRLTNDVLLNSFANSCLAPGLTLL